MSDCNVLGGALEQGGTDPLTGFYRDGCCATGPEDLGWHTICAVMTSDLHTFSYEFKPWQHEKATASADAIMVHRGRSLAAHLDDPADRLNAIHASMRGNKNVLSQLPRAQALAVSLLLLSPAALNTLPGLAKATPPPFNVCISNVPGAREPLYFNGARMVGNYPMSLVLDGQALNITLTSTADSLDFGVVGCRRSVPHVQRVLSHLETSLKELERAVGL